MFTTWYRRAMKRRRIVKALFNSCGGVTIVGDESLFRRLLSYQPPCLCSHHGGADASLW